MTTVSVPERHGITGYRSGRCALGKIAFIDLEASGLLHNSWPVEVGWCFPAGQPSACLIRPAEDWDTDAWDPQAEALHGISRDMLSQTGISPSRVCARLNMELRGAKVYSDAPDWDELWLYRLYKAAGMNKAFAILDFNDLFADRPPDMVRSALPLAEKLAPHCHRAGKDVLHMQALFAIVQGA